ncbi:hypothetical protein CVD27_25375 [Neobacillus cucumis]|uniref:Uncharacterized protein n=1 Tax=Neobacillus cucumis TaxID=1740721 RepID=A0A2N5H7B9_9BACI|nr:hypothetical protein CVD27_25375 [Neobacillus cucumis]
MVEIRKAQGARLLACDLEPMASGAGQLYFLNLLSKALLSSAMLFLMNFFRVPRPLFLKLRLCYSSLFIFV